MRLFDTPGADAAYDRWLDPPDQHEECGCLTICHAAHIEDHVFEAGCEFCVDEKCEPCGGTGYVADGDAECERCGAAGRVASGRV